MTHAWHDITPGSKLPGEFTTVIEIPRGSRNKYEIDHEDGKVYLDGITDLNPGDFVEAEVTGADEYDLWAG